MKEALLVDDHPVVRKGLKDFLIDYFSDLSVSETDGRQSVVSLICERRWEFILLDLHLADSNGLDVLKHATASGASSPIIIFSVEPAEEYADRALRAGASAYLSKDCSAEEIVRTIERAIKVKPTTKRYLNHVLSDREAQVLSLLADGMPQKQVAHILNISPKTVSTYHARLRLKLGVHTLAGLIKYAAHEKLVLKRTPLPPTRIK